MRARRGSRRCGCAQKRASGSTASDPGQRRAQLGDALRRSFPLGPVGQQRPARGRERVGVLRRDGAAEAAALDQVGQRVARRAHVREARPQVVEHPGPEGEAGLEVVVVGGDAEVGLQQPRPPLRVGDPVVVDVHALAQQSQRLGVGQRPRRARDRVHRLEPGPLEPLEDQVHGGVEVVQARHRVDAGDGVQPVPDPAAPQQHAVVGADPRPRALQHRRRRRSRWLGRQPERHHVDERAQARVGAVAVQRDQPVQREPAQPQVALLLGRADDEVGSCAHGQRRQRGQRLRAPLRRARAVPHRLQHLHRARVVEVGHEPDRQPPHVAQHLRRQLLGHEHVVVGRRRQHAVEVGEARLQQRHPVVGQHAGCRGGQRRRVACARQRPRDLERPDGRARHALAHRLGGQHEDAAHALIPAASRSGHGRRRRRANSTAP